MKLIDRYIQKYVLLSTLVVLAVISILEMTFFLAEELVGTNSNYSSLDALTYVLKIMVRDVYELLPFAALGGGLIGLGILASNNELIIVQAAGVSTKRIVWSTMKPTLVVMFIGLLLGEFVAPQLEEQAQSNKSQSQLTVYLPKYQPLAIA